MRNFFFSFLKRFTFIPLILKCYILFSWLSILTFNIYFNSNAKYKYYAQSDAQFMLKFDAYKNQSLLALKHIHEWLHVNKIEKPIFNRQQTKNDDNKKQTLCIGIMSMKRLGQRFYTIQTVTSLLTRVKFKYQDRIVINILNLNRNISSHHDLIFLNGLIQVIDISLPKNDNSSSLSFNIFDWLKVSLF